MKKQAQKNIFRSRTFQALAAAIAVTPFISCRQGWIGDARLYNSRETHYVSSFTAEEKTPAPGETDPFNVTACWNKIDYVFDGEMLDGTLVLPHISFDSDNIPRYVFGERNAGWDLSYSKTNEYTYNAGNEGNRAQASEFDENGLPKDPSLVDGGNGYSITPMTVYQFRGKNPMFSPTCGYNTGTRMERFRFYRMTGKSAGIIDLDQFVLAVDTYSKFAFVYAYITETAAALGQKIPIEYQPMELYSEKRPFYEYDPIGYLASDGSGEVIFYNHYRDDMLESEAVGFMPSIHPMATEKMAERCQEDGAGRSPYYPELYE